MVNEIVRQAFQQALEETPNVTKTGLSKHISKKIEENDMRKIFSYKTFTRYYDKYILGKEGVIDHPQAEIIEELCKYLGYENYQIFVNEYKMSEGWQFANKNNGVEYSEIQLAEVVGNKLFKDKRCTEKPFINKSILAQMVLTIILILFFKINWEDKECLLCMDEYSILPKVQSNIYNEVLFKKNTKSSDTAFIFYKMEDLCYGTEIQTRSF